MANYICFNSSSMISRLDQYSRIYSKLLWH